MSWLFKRCQYNGHTTFMAHCRALDWLILKQMTFEQNICLHHVNQLQHLVIDSHQAVRATSGEDEFFSSLKGNARFRDRHPSQHSNTGAGTKQFFQKYNYGRQQWSFFSSCHHMGLAQLGDVWHKHKNNTTGPAPLGCRQATTKAFPCTNKISKDYYCVLLAGSSHNRQQATDTQPRITLFKQPTKWYTTNSEDPTWPKSILFDDLGNLIQKQDIEIYQLLGMGTPQYRIDLKKLQKNFLKLQIALHPDKFGGQSSEQTSRSLDWSAYVNHAVSTLRDPLNRAKYMMKHVHNICIDKEQTVQDQELVMKVMQYRMDIEDSSTLNEIKEVLGDVNKSFDETVEQIATALDQQDAEQSTLILHKLSYLDKALQAGKDKLFEIEHASDKVA